MTSMMAEFTTWQNCDECILIQLCIGRVMLGNECAKEKTTYLFEVEHAWIVSIHSF
jgi:hypothetical protein